MKAETPSAKRWRICVIGKTICVKKLRKDVAILGNSMEKTKKNLEMIYFV